ncbi:MAG: protoporphyrinogen oxidase [Candidatus Marinimicrobia bacterium]|nr:protoporphyrinogen oxidase [Candidatus Neomarinimicrobiota bacterium]MCF7827774.1 protoporphyrinogen oxidase [Candidatus Neomarinimicrobiota bacterium]MCF7879471.1 protoporphyrinogen oxidase [Candidatus Neomarinimicrobiota bacterium]
MNEHVDVVVIGAGVSGLSAAYWLKQQGHSVQILEKADRIGGSIQTTREDGFIIEHGPNSGMETNPVIGKLVESLGLEDQMIYANDEANNRYIVRDKELHPLPMAPLKFFKTKLFSRKAKWRVPLELFIGKAPEDKEETVAEFVSRRLGPEFLDYAINPFVAGVFAGDPKELSVKAAFPKLAALEENYGGIFKGVIKGRRERKKRLEEGEESKQSAQMFSFRNGLGTLTESLGSELADSIETGVEVQSVASGDDEWQVTYSKDGESREVSADSVLFAVPAYVASEFIRDLDNETAAALDAIPYAKAIMMYSAFDKKDVPIDLDGFGYLIPEKEEMNILGTIWSTTVFENRAPEGKVSFTTFVGGRRQPEKLELSDEELLQQMREDFAILMGVEARPEKLFIRRWPKAIPQYTLGHLEREARMETFEENHPGLFITGNHRGGISVADCIKHSEPRAEAIYEYLKTKTDSTAETQRKEKQIK